jgi:predicted enzyme related to lactoylglutathione lyase
MKKNSVAHFEIYADDPDALGKFYTSLFDWTIEPMAGMD